MAPKGRKEDWESLDTNADARLPAVHSVVFVINAVLLTGAPSYLFSAIFDLNPEENMAVYGGVSGIVGVIVFLACQNRAKGIRTRLLKSRGVELESTTALKSAGDDKTKARSKESDKKRSEINAEALALSLAHTNAIFLCAVVFMSFWIMRASSAPVNFAVSSLISAATAFIVK